MLNHPIAKAGDLVIELFGINRKRLVAKNLAIITQLNEFQGIAQTRFADF